MQRSNSLPWGSRRSSQKYLAHRAKQPSPYGLREMDAAIEKVSGYINAISNSFLGYERYMFDLEDEAIWPLFFEKVDTLKASILGLGVGSLRIPSS
jgi:hypothetical protein